MLCQKIHLEKLPHEDLASHLQKLAKKRWNELLREQTVDTILSLSECHPYYVNFLCDKLWDSNVLPVAKTVEKKWYQCLEIQKDKLIADLAPLSATRLKVLSTIALQDGVSAPNGKKFLDTTGLALGTVQKGLQFLLGNDFIYRNEASNQINLVDPLLKLFLRQQDKS